MALSFFTIYVGLNLVAVLALMAAPFIFFNVYAENTSGEWEITILDGASNSNQDLAFLPDELPFQFGDLIVISNNDVVTHSISSGVPKYPEDSGEFFYTGKIPPGESISFVVEEKVDFGAFYYFCEIHPWMTGKIFVSDTQIAQPETDRPIEIEKELYYSGETIRISGQVHDDFANTDYKVLIYDQGNNLIDMIKGDFNEDGTYSQTIPSEQRNLRESGNYLVKLVYALPSKVAQTNFVLSNEPDGIGTKLVPRWIENIAEFWCNGQINDSEFIAVYQYLIHQQIIILDHYEPNSESTQAAPDWIKNKTCWWSDDNLKKLDFISGIQVLVNTGIIKI